MDKTKEQIYTEIKQILLESDKPSEELKKLINNGEFNEYPFKMLVDLKSVEQNLTFHKEGNVFNHTMLVVDKASILKTQSENQKVFMLSALLHDIGKLKTTKVSKSGKITSYGHDKSSSKLVKEFLEGLEDEDTIKDVSKLTLYHMQSLYYQHKSDLFNSRGILKDVDINDLFLLTMADRTGRGGVSEEDEILKINRFKKYLDDRSK